MKEKNFCSTLLTVIQLILFLTMYSNEMNFNFIFFLCTVFFGQTDLFTSPMSMVQIAACISAWSLSPRPGPSSVASPAFTQLVSTFHKPEIICFLWSTLFFKFLHSMSYLSCFLFHPVLVLVSGCCN